MISEAGQRLTLCELIHRLPVNLQCLLPRFCNILLLLFVPSNLLDNIFLEVQVEVEIVGCSDN